MNQRFIDYPEIEDTRYMRRTMAALSNAVHADSRRFNKLQLPGLVGPDYSVDPETGEILE